MNRFGCHPSVSVPFSEWPEDDQAHWRQALVSDDLDRRPTPLSKWAKGHQEAARRHYGAWLKFLLASEPDCFVLSPGERMSRVRFAAYLRHLRSRVAIDSVARSLCDFLGVMQSIAPDGDWRWIKKLIRSAYREAETIPKKQKPFVHASELVRVGEELIRGAFGADREIADPVAFRDGLIILTLVMVPVRITQLSSLDESKHLLWDDGQSWVAHWEKEETKSRRSDDHPIAPELAEVLQIYLRQVRPKLMDASGEPESAKTIWIGKRGISIGSQTLRKIIKARTAEALGRSVNPHSFRHSVATTYALEMPGRAMEAASILSHLSFETSERYYLLGRRVQAVKVAHAALEVARAKRSKASLQ